MAPHREGTRMLTAGRLHTEAAFHDEQARRRADDLRDPEALRVDVAGWLVHETWIRPAFDGLAAHLGGLAGRDVLDFGCGHGMAAIAFADAGANVTAFDLSVGYLREAAARAEASGVDVRFVRADGEQLPFAANSFDGIWGNAVLHHLDPDRAGAELRRVLRPGGVAVFCEPWGGNPLLAVARRRIPYPGKHRTPDERPLHLADVRALRRHFPTLSWRGHQLFGMLRRAGRLSRSLLATLDRVDAGLLAAWPGLENLCRYVVLTLPA